MEHVHGLAIDPGDGLLYAGTHHGVFRVPEDGGTSRLEGPVQDLLGFTIARPGLYVADAHPVEGQPDPPVTGVVASSDGGRTWTPLPGSEGLDLHSIKAANDRLYAFDGARFMVNEDGSKWEARAQVPLADFAVGPGTPDTIIATTRDGIMRSVNGGRSFAKADGPKLLLLAWPSEHYLVGITAEGQLHTSTDSGRTWEAGVSAGATPHALTATDDHIFIALPGGIAGSSDGGQTFKPIYLDGK